MPKEKCYVLKYYSAARYVKIISLAIPLIVVVVCINANKVDLLVSSHSERNPNAVT